MRFAEMVGTGELAPEKLSEKFVTVWTVGRGVEY